ncbi:hypothetical protein AB7307_21285 [Providencia alcalifaciens]
MSVRHVAGGQDGRPSAFLPTPQPDSVGSLQGHQVTFAAYPRPVGAAVFHGSLDPLSVQSAPSEGQSQGHARKPHAERRA